MGQDTSLAGELDPRGSKPMTNTANRPNSSDPARHAHRAMRLAALAALALAIASPGPLAGTALADPPPWAPAHGYRAKQKNKHGRKHRRRAYVQEQAYRAPEVGIPSGSCNRDIIGALIGAAAGGYAGAQFGKGDGKLAATGAGALIGLLIGGSVGRSMDRVDQNCIAQTLEQAEDNRAVAWRNPDARTDYRVTPTRTYSTNDGRYCREYTTEAKIGSKTQLTYGTACRQPDGSWEIKS